jgi:benzoyl-CoA reductase/2-hydroxyglutaryl-CoA dehydratase subunit BcrC/BadD/HgdB
MGERLSEKAIGITSTVPLEIIFAAGLVPVDLNNRFITDAARRSLVERAEADGFPLNFCAWIKGIYAYAKAHEVKRVIGVSEGDCSNTHALMEALADDGVEVIPFAYPRTREPRRLLESMADLARRLGTNLDKAEETREAMRPLRTKLTRLDEMTWRDGKVTGFENHEWLINSSDMRGDWREFEAELDKFLGEAKDRKALDSRWRLGFAGIPPIVDGLYEALEARGAGVVYNEFQRQFSMPGEHGSLVEEYLAYTYPYETALRIADITAEAANRKLDGIVHYVQSFCFRQLADRTLRKAVRLPVLTLEFDRPGGLDARSVTRLEAFIEVLEGQRRIQAKADR